MDLGSGIGPIAESHDRVDTFEAKVLCDTPTALRCTC
jgi:hypothetical protein